MSQRDVDGNSGGQKSNHSARPKTENLEGAREMLGVLLPDNGAVEGNGVGNGKSGSGREASGRGPRQTERGKNAQVHING